MVYDMVFGDSKAPYLWALKQNDLGILRECKSAQIGGNFAPIYHLKHEWEVISDEFGCLVVARRDSGHLEEISFEGEDGSIDSGAMFGERKRGFTRFARQNMKTLFYLIIPIWDMLFSKNRAYYSRGY